MEEAGGGCIIFLAHGSSDISGNAWVDGGAGGAANYTGGRGGNGTFIKGTIVTGDFIPLN